MVGFIQETAEIQQFYNENPLYQGQKTRIQFIIDATTSQQYAQNQSSKKKNSPLTAAEVGTPESMNQAVVSRNVSQRQVQKQKQVESLQNTEGGKHRD